jgi:hypothetical protein
MQYLILASKDARIVCFCAQLGGEPSYGTILPHRMALARSL